MDSEKFVGKVIWFDAKLGYGFIHRPGEKDLFVHYSDIQAEGFKVIKKGQQVAFSIGLNNRKQPKATNVVVIEAEEDGEEA